jgi:hypothetical protein
LENRGRLDPDSRRPHLGHRRFADLPLVSQPTKELLKGPEPLGYGGRPMAAFLEGNEERLDVLAVDLVDIPRHPGGVEEVPSCSIALA